MIEFQAITSDFGVWLFANKVEIFGFLVLVFYLYFSIKQNILLWPFGLIGALVYIYIYYSAQLYADMSLQVYYVLISIYGWFYWKTAKDKNENVKLEVKYTNKNLALLLLITTLFLFIIFSFILAKYTNASLPYWDALTTAAGITATWMLAKKYIEHWIVWVFVNIISVIIYIYKDLHITAVLFVIYTTMAIVGYFQWRKQLIKLKI